MMGGPCPVCAGVNGHHDLSIHDHFWTDPPPALARMIRMLGEARIEPTLAEKVEQLPLYDPEARTMADAAESMRRRAVAAVEEGAP